MTQLWTHGYRLEGRSGSAIGDRHGVLLRVETLAGFGYADLHPWESLGDLPLTEQLALLREGTPTGLACRTLSVAKRDAEARAKGVSLLARLAVPESHLLAGSPTALGPAFFDDAVGRGFTRIKVKLGADLSEEIVQLLRILPELPAALSLRLDFNEKLTPLQFREFLACTRPWHERIDFIEDPCPEPVAWERVRAGSRVALACDRRAGAVATQGPDVEVIVLKPALQDVAGLLSHALPDRWVVTSYLDHPLGQVAAAVVAAELAAQFPGWVDVCGLLSHTVYEETPFSAGFSSGPDFVAPAGTGLGFDELLERLPWTRLS